VNFGSLLRAFDTVMAFRDAARRLTGATAERAPDTTLVPGAPSSGPGAQLEARLTNVVVAALKEAFDRDHARLELERAQIEDQRRRAEEAMRLELRRQAAEREVGRLRLLAGAALVGWIASVLVLGAGIAAMPVAARTVLGGGWVLLLGALAASFSAQARIGDLAVDSTSREAGPAAAAALWLLVAGLAATAMSLLIR
jgi:hypothetical protein